MTAAMSRAQAKARAERRRADWVEVLSRVSGRRVLEEIRSFAAGEGESLPFEGAAASHAIGRLEVARFVESRVCDANTEWLGQMRSDLGHEPEQAEAEAEDDEA